MSSMQEDGFAGSHREEIGTQETNIISIIQPRNYQAHTDRRKLHGDRPDNRKPDQTPD